LLNFLTAGCGTLGAKGHFDNFKLMDELEQAAAKGLSQREAAAQLGISYRHVQTLAQTLQVEWKRQEKVSFSAKVLTLAAIELGVPKLRLAKVLGVHHTAILRWGSKR